MKASHALLALVVSGIVAAPVGAVDKALFKCESGATAAITKWGGSRGKCLIKCQQGLLKGDPRDCTGPAFDVDTTACMSAADAKATAAVQKVCLVMPTCNAYAGETAASYTASQLAEQAAFIDGTTLPVLVCDPTQFKCEAKVVGTLAKLAGSLGKCLGKCYSALQVKGDVTRQCTPDMVGDPFDTLDATTAGCITAANAKATASIMKACPTLGTAPACALYALPIPVLLDVVTGALGDSYADPSTNPFCAM